MVGLKEKIAMFLMLQGHLDFKLTCHLNLGGVHPNYHIFDK